MQKQVMSTYDCARLQIDVFGVCVCVVGSGWGWGYAGRGGEFVAHVIDWAWTCGVNVEWVPENNFLKLPT